MTAVREGEETTEGNPRPEVPDLDEVAGHWVAAADLAHLPSLRNQVGQGHVNADLSSLSWLAAPPFSFGYHTGVLRLDGQVLPAQRFRWKPWGVQREHSGTAVTIRTDTRMALGEDTLLWLIEAANDTGEPVDVAIEQDLFAMVAHTDTGWGWLYDVPWNAGNYHDFMTLERIRSAVTATPAPGYLLGPGRRILRLGKPRLPGIQRDTASEAMSLEYELPRHVSDDTVYPYREGAAATVRNLRCCSAGASDPILSVPQEITLNPDGEVSVGVFDPQPGQLIEFQLRPDTLGQSGIVLTHGNHPDSLQLGIDGGRLWFAISGQQADAGELEAGRWHEVSIELHEDRVRLSLDGRPSDVTSDWTAAARWTAASDGSVVTIADSRSPARACYSFDVAPSALQLAGAGATATWTATLGPHQKLRIGIVCAYGDNGGEVVARAARAAASFGSALEEVEDGYRDLWHAMFTPGNPHFSGHLPVLKARDAGISRSYYMAALLALYMRNIRASATEPVFLTGGPRLGPTTTYFWDHTEWSRLYALLEPAGMRSWLLRALASPYDRAFGFDTKNGGPLGNRYSATDYSLFRLVEHYVAVTRDIGFLQEHAGGMTVLAHVDRLAHGWEARRTAATGGILADFGADPWTLLECVPGYTNAVASFNAAYAGMMRSLANLRRLLGQDEAAAVADAQADTLARAVVRMSAPGGRWQIKHPGKTETIGHCLDFGLVAAYLYDDLSQAQRDAMVRFASRELLASTWMRALALDDPAAPFSNRPDHGSAGAFCAWPGVTAYGLAKLGRGDLSAALLSVVHASASGALWGQAMEITADAEGTRVRVAEDGVSNRDSIAGVATAEAIVSGLFGFEPSYRTLAGPPLPDRIDIPEIGSLSSLNVGARPVGLA
jgi:hypothetical protein